MSNDEAEWVLTDSEGRVIMTKDEQEALSQKYYCWGILRLKSGKYAIFDRSFQLKVVVSDPAEFDLSFDAANKYRQQFSQPRVERPKPSTVKLSVSDILKDII